MTTFIDINLKRKEMTYRDLIEKRKSCKVCGICEDLNLKHEKGKLYQLETATKFPLRMDSLGLWDPMKNSNPLISTTLIIGKDFGNVGYFDQADTFLRLGENECKNTTNRNLIRYIELVSNIDKNEIYFTNTVLCIKGGRMNAPLKTQWINNCSELFLKPLIQQYLINLKNIITLGIDALEAIKKISNFSTKDKFSSLPGKNFTIKINGNSLQLYPMFHTGNFGYVNASKAKQNPEELWKNLKLEL